MSPVSKSITLNDGKPMPTVGLGVYLLPLDDCADIVNNALEIGYRHLDSARVYGNERETAEGIAKFLKNHPNVKREEIFYTTKIWPTDHGFEATKAALQESYEDVHKEIQYIDLVLLHNPRSGPKRRLEAYQVLQDAVEKGIVKSIGVSNYGVHHLEELFSQPWLKIKPAVNQIEINPWCQQSDIVDYCKKHSIAVQAYSPLMFGHRLDDPELVALGKKYNKSSAQILIRWNLQKGFTPLPKTVRTSRLKENIDVFDFEISDEDVAQLGSGKGKYLPGGDDPTVHKP
jgi:diketogulonate reductase-like aldo/keto reductase